MEYTTNLELKKPDSNDYVRISDINENMDAIDEAVGELDEGKADVSDHNLQTYTSLAQLGLTVGSETMATIATALPGESQFVLPKNASSNSVADGTGYPVESSGAVVSYGILTVKCTDSSHTQVEFTFVKNAIAPVVWVGYYNSASGGWRGWGDPIATQTTPTEYELALNETVATEYSSAYKCCYSKTQDGIVTINCLVSLVDATASTTLHIGTLPSGYRPSTYVVTTGRFAAASNVYYATSINIATTGGIYAYNAAAGVTGMAFCVSFVAADS